MRRGVFLVPEMKPLFSGSCRKFRLNTGPTNSGKTWRALEDLKKAKSGVYAAPLRLLAFEGWRKLNEAGVPTNLLTGQQRIEVPGARHVACTVEMFPSQQNFAVGVIDEIQLISDTSRGWSWTRAAMQSKCDEMIFCGQKNAVPLMHRILASNRATTVTEESFKRLNTLVVEDQAASRISPGDCIVCFSRKELYRIKHGLEEEGCRVSIVYGALPPEARVVQAEQFNEGGSVLVATDAVGLGLNLKIRRVVFSTVRKFDGTEMRLLTACEVKQIAGRSGRGDTDECGLVTAFEEEDRQYIAACLASDSPELEKAGWLPTLADLTLLNGGDVRETASLSKLYGTFLELHESLPQERDFFLCETKDILRASSMCDSEGGELSLDTRFTYSMAPVDLDDELVARYFALYLRQHVSGRGVRLMVKVYEDESEIERRLDDDEREETAQRIARLESLYAVIDMYLWLGTRFGAEIYPETEHAVAMRDACANEVDQLILRLGYRPAKPKKLKKLPLKKKRRD